MRIDWLGWDLGGAHVKAVGLRGNDIVAVQHVPCPLWQGLDRLEQAVASVLTAIAPTDTCRHAVTMTGELVDLFENREQGVLKLVETIVKALPGAQISLFAGMRGFCSPDSVDAELTAAIASANWLATGLFAASRIDEALMIDIGSTTSDLLILSDAEVAARGMTDAERLHFEELVYTGVVRTPLMALAEAVPFAGDWVGVMAEHFATTADVYRLTGELPDHADQAATADGRDKSLMSSERRIARLLGLDVNSAGSAAWRGVADYFREQQLSRLGKACARQLSRGILSTSAPLLGAGVGRFMVNELARRLGRPTLDFVELLPQSTFAGEFQTADCAPAASVALLARQRACL